VSDGKENPTVEVTYLYEVFAFRLGDKWLKLWSCEGVHETSL
jgi:hypothetical protein